MLRNPEGLYCGEREAEGAGRGLSQDWDANDLGRKAAFVARQQEREMRKRPYVRLPPDHPLFDAEDLPHWWQRWLAEGVGGAILAVFTFGAAVYAYHYMPNPLPGWLDALTRWLLG